MFMQLHFYKYQGTGNDFVMIDNRQAGIKLNVNQVKFICDRRFGVGADGLILLENEDGYDFKMVYYNSDGGESTMCGNGGRCITRFAFDLGIVREEYKFLAVDGLHLATKNKNNEISLKMIDVGSVEDKPNGADIFVDTGSPHYVSFSKEVESLSLLEKAREIRYSDEYNRDGVNVNFVEIEDNSDLRMRTYERGVEDETYSCGTGVTAAVLGAYHKGLINSKEVRINTKGGNLGVKFETFENGYKAIWLTGPATYVYKGEITI